MSVMVTDPIADMLTRIRNANQQRHAEVVIPHSRLKVELAEILKNEGFVSGYKVEGEGAIKNIVVTLKYKGNERVISGLREYQNLVYVNMQKLTKFLRY